MSSNHVIPFCVVWDECGSTRICMDHVLLGLVGLLSNLGTIPLPACMLKLGNMFRRNCSVSISFHTSRSKYHELISFAEWFCKSRSAPSSCPVSIRGLAADLCAGNVWTGNIYMHLHAFTSIYYMSYWRLTCISEHLAYKVKSSYTNSLDLFPVSCSIFFIACPFSPIFMPTLGTKNPNDALDQAALAVLWRCLWASSFDNPYEKLPLRIRVIHNS